jgi:hypothetical protein
MKLFKKMKDGGPESTVTGYWLIECKSLFSIVLLRFNGKSRPVYHQHAFNSISWLLDGVLKESFLGKMTPKYYTTSFRPFITRRTDFHKVDSIGYDNPAWVLSFRGPRKETWQEFDIDTAKYRRLRKGRKIVYG